MISHKYKFIFVHVPKTGGTSVVTELESFGLSGSGHIRLGDIKNRYKLTTKQYNEYTKFAVVRNPWDWVFSNYNYIKMEKSYWHSKDNTTKYGVHPDYNLVKNITFSEFIFLLKDGKITSKYNSYPQSYWLNGDLDYILKLENINKDLVNLCNRLDIKKKIKLPHINKSNDLDYRDFYNQELVKIIYEIYREDIERFKYIY